MAIIDLLTGVHAFSAIIAALLNREKNGTGEIEFANMSKKCFQIEKDLGQSLLDHFFNL